MSTDAIVLLKKDHQEMRKLFRQFEKAAEDDVPTRAELGEQILAALTVHTYLENEVMYPAVRDLLPDVEDDVLESYEEHHVADVLCLELEKLPADHERFVPKMSVLMESVEHHMDEEEQEWFPKVREGLGRKQLQEIGERMQSLRPQAPTRPSDPKAIKKAVDAVKA